MGEWKIFQNAKPDKHELWHKKCKTEVGKKNHKNQQHKNEKHNSYNIHKMCTKCTQI